MKTSTRLALFVVAVLFAAVEMKAQESSAVRPRVVTAAQEQQPPAQPDVPQAKPAELGPTLACPSKLNAQKKVSAPITHLTPSMIQARISEAQRMFKTRPSRPRMAVARQIEFVTIAALDRETARTHFITISKKTFLTKGAEINTTTSEGTSVTVRIVRANGVNTAMTIFTPDGKSLAPLTIEYPIERGGKFLETGLLHFGSSGVAFNGSRALGSIVRAQHARSRCQAFARQGRRDFAAARRCG